MEKSVRPVSENYPSMRCPLNESTSYSSEAGLVNDEGDRAPIFSMSKSSMDVKTGGPPHKRDPAWTRLDLRRSSSTNTHSEQNAVTLRQLHPNLWQHSNSQQPSPTTQNMDLHSPPALSDRWMSNVQRWSGCSSGGGGTQSRSSTPDTVVWRGGSSRPSSLTQEISSTSTPNSSMSRLTSPPATPSPLISPMDSMFSPREDVVSPTSPASTLTSNQQEDLPEPTTPNSPSGSPQQTPDLQSSPADLPRLTSTEDQLFLENNMLAFQFPSPIPSSDCLTEAGMSSEPKCLVDDVIEKLCSPRDTQLLEDEGETSSVKPFTYMMPSSPAEGQQAGDEPSVSHLELPRQLDPSRPTGRGKRSALVSSLSDSGLGHCCKCNLSTREGVWRGDAFRGEAAVTSQKEMVDTAVQTASPLGSWWDLRRTMSNSNMDSHSILGSPPGSRLNLKSSVGSNSNLVSPSSSMFPVSGEEEEEAAAAAKRGGDPAWDVTSASSHDLERRRSCLKMQVEEKDAMGRRSSMKQVQWDEDGMTWDVHGASVDPEVLSTAILKHLELQNTPRPLRRSSKKKRAPEPPDMSSAAPATATPPVTSDETEGDVQREAEQEGEAKEEEAAEAPRRRSRAEADLVKDEDEVYGGEGALVSKSQAHGGGHIRKRSVIRSLRRPGWCGGSRKEQD